MTGDTISLDRHREVAARRVAILGGVGADKLQCREVSRRTNGKVRNGVPYNVAERPSEPRPPFYVANSRYALSYCGGELRLIDRVKAEYHGAIRRRTSL